jgi:hypothetical protein
VDGDVVGGMIGVGTSEMHTKFCSKKLEEEKYLWYPGLDKRIILKLI